MEPTIEAEARVDEIHKAKDCQDQAENHESQCEENFNGRLTAKAIQEFCLRFAYIQFPKYAPSWIFFNYASHWKSTGQRDIPVAWAFMLGNVHCVLPLCQIKYRIKSFSLYYDSVTGKFSYVVYSHSTKSNIEVKLFSSLSVTGKCSYPYGHNTPASTFVTAYSYTILELPFCHIKSSSTQF